VTDRVEMACGLALGALVLGLACLPGLGSFALAAPIFFIMPGRFQYPNGARWFFLIYALGSACLKLWGDGRISNMVIPEILAVFFLLLTPDFIQATQDRARRRFDEEFERRKRELELKKLEADRLRHQNAQIEKQLRQVEHLYDVIKEAGSTLNVQEMIELARDFTDRMFDLPHFILGALSNDGRRFEVRIASGCDEAFLKSVEIEPDSNQLGAKLARESKPLWVRSLASDPRFSKWKDLPIRSFVFLPFLVQERVIGFLCSFSHKEDFLDEEKFSNLQVFCNQISIGLQKSLLYEKVQKLSITDGLTKLFSHRYFKLRLEEEIVLATRYSSELSLLILDIDHFKHYNDNYGHVAGDHVLMEMAKILQEQSEVTHLAARYGGEEMVLVAAETSKGQAMELAEKLRRAVESHPFQVGKETTQVTVSVGVATFPQDSSSMLDLIAKADQALYAAKARGRNRVVAFPF
jgi:diguanylate cyclase (GGDEF)-like protein